MQLMAKATAEASLGEGFGGAEQREALPASNWAKLILRNSEEVDGPNA